MTFDPDWKERREKIEGYYRAIGKMGMNDMGKIKAIEKVLDNQLLAYYVIIQEIKDILDS